MRRGVLLGHLGGAALFFSCAACRPSETTSTAPGSPASTRSHARPMGPMRCTPVVDVVELLARHARAYGSPAAVEAALPVVISGAAAVEGRSGKTEIVVTKEAHRSQAWIAGLFGASGVDASGAWSIDGGSGLVERLSGVEAIAPQLEGWMLRRSYQSAFDAARDVARCEDMGTGARVDLTFKRPELGTPVLAFDLESGALLALAHEQADGSSTRTTYEAWSDAERGVRWPRKSSDHPLAGSVSTQDYAGAAHGRSSANDAVDCVRFDATGVAVPERGSTCFAPPPDRFVMRWPSGDRPRVRVPFLYLGSELVMRAKIGGRDAWAFLDSGASATAVDATTPAGAQFHAAIELAGSGATQRLRVGFGELPAIDLGDGSGAGLHAEHIPTVSVPIPALDAFGDKRPELILGYSFFAAAVVRVDYKRLEVTFAKSTDGMFAKGNEPRALPLRVLKSKMVVDGTIEGAPAPFQIDTGNGGGLDLYKKWAAAHGLPGARPVVEVKGRFGVGAGETEATFFRLGKASLGLIAFDDHLTHVGDPPAPGILAGLAGNEVLARCDAVVFDVAKRTLWLEGTCDRAVPEKRVGWRFEKKVDATIPDRPWVISRLWPSGAAERAGVQLGDRVMEMGGKPATADVAPLWAMEQQPVGTKLRVVLRRGTSLTRLTIELRALGPEAMR